MAALGTTGGTVRARMQPINNRVEANSAGGYAGILWQYPANNWFTQTGYAIPAGYTQEECKYDPQGQALPENAGGLGGSSAGALAQGTASGG